MATREEFMAHLWRKVINGPMRVASLDNLLRNCDRDPEGAFADTGAAVRRMLEAGVAKRDLCLFARSTAYKTVFAVLYALQDPGLDGPSLHGLHELLLSSDPSGLEGRPGSAPE